MKPVSALLLREPHLTRILDGSKTWEIRGSQTKYRGRLILARSGTGMLIGECRLVGVSGPLSMNDLCQSPRLPVAQKHMHQEAGVLPYVRKDGSSRTYAWEISDPITYRRPIPYIHPQGAVIFVSLSQNSAPEWFASQSGMGRTDPNDGVSL